MPRIKDRKTLAAAGAEMEEGRRPTIVPAPARKLSTWPFNLTQNVSSESRQNRHSNQPPPGSTRQPNGYESKLKFKYRLSQRFHGEWIATDSLAE
jgi:hypothetical protein